MTLDTAITDTGHRAVNTPGLETGYRLEPLLGPGHTEASYCSRDRFRLVSGGLVSSAVVILGQVVLGQCAMYLLHGAGCE